MDRDERIAELRAACGCKESLLALVVAVTAYLLLPQYFPTSETIWGVVLIGVGVALGGAVIGKLAGLLIAQARLRRLLRRPTLADHF
jgi:hypothetical protein